MLSAVHLPALLQHTVAEVAHGTGPVLVYGSRSLSRLKSFQGLFDAILCHFRCKNFGLTIKTCFILRRFTHKCLLLGLVLTDSSCPGLCFEWRLVLLVDRSSVLGRQGDSDWLDSDGRVGEYVTILHLNNFHNGDAKGRTFRETQSSQGNVQPLRGQHRRCCRHGKL